MVGSIRGARPRRACDTAAARVCVADPNCMPPTRDSSGCRLHGRSPWHDLHRATQGPLLRRRLRRDRPNHRAGAATMAPRRHQPDRCRARRPPHRRSRTRCRLTRRCRSVGSSRRRGCHANGHTSARRQRIATHGSSRTTCCRGSVTYRCDRFDPNILTTSMSISSRGRTRRRPTRAKDGARGTSRGPQRARPRRASSARRPQRCSVGALSTTPRRRHRPWPGYGTPMNYAPFSHAAKDQRLYPALHLAAHTGMRRGELVGLKWTDFDATGRRVSICRTIQCLAGRPVESGPRHEQVAAASTSTAPPSRFCNDGVAGYKVTDYRTASTTGCSATLPGDS